jgi:hypothetical protein
MSLPNGQVENQVGLVRERFFTPRLRVKSYEELNAWLLDQCVAYARAHRHPEIREHTIWEAFEAERSSLVRYGGRFDGSHAMPASVSKTCLVPFDNNRYSVSAHAVGRPVEIRAYADGIEPRQDGRLVGDHARCFGRDQTVFDPWHYVPVLARKPRALRNGAPFKDWVLPAGLQRVPANLPARPMAIGRWPRSWPRCSTMGCRRSRRPVRKRYASASTRRTSSSISWRGAVNPRLQPPS